MCFFEPRQSDGLSPLSFLGDFDPNKMIGIFNEALTASKKLESGIVDSNVRKVINVAFNLFEFVTSHNQLVLGAGKVDEYRGKIPGHVPGYISEMVSCS